jgi:phage terminase large subunit GpA-like protein
MVKRPKKAASDGLAAWIEGNVELPQGTTAEPGPVHLWPWQVEIANAISEPAFERVTLVKPTRVGFTALLTSAIAYHVVRDPGPILCLLPTEADCRDFLVSDVEPLFEASPALAGRLPTPTTAGRSSRNTLLHRIYPGGSLKCVAGKAPRNLRRHTCRILMIDEADAIEVSAEGDPISLAERRTLSFANRKIIVGSTPLDEATSHVMRAYLASDQRVYEVPCPACGGYAEILWRHIEWPEGRPEAAAYRCPHCDALVPESHKPEMVQRARWRATAPDVRDHAGFRLNALVSLLPNAAWGKLAAEFLRAKDDTDTLRVFVNTTLGEPWREQADEVNEADLMARVEGFDLDNIPAAVLAITIGVDCQDDRLEASVIGHGRDATMYVPAHTTIWGSPHDEDTWSELDKLLLQRWRHPHGGVLKADAAVVDAGDGGVYDIVLRFCNARISRRILAGKGASGFGRPIIQASKTKRGRLFIIGVDNAKAQILTRLSRGTTIRFSHTLEATYFEQLASERRVVRMTRGRPVARFERKIGARAESLDCMVYAMAAKAALSLNAAAFDQREDALRTSAPQPAPAPSVIRSKWVTGRAPSWERYS